QKEFNGKTLNVSEAKPSEEKPRRSFDNNRGGGYGNNNNRGGGYGNNNRGGGGNRW
ncbi:MAG TPA: RNA-binding protein, partial [Chryseobacterium indologenes]|nr:RNA-binding protein [Chryseobacterium indologenes]